MGLKARQLVRQYAVPAFAVDEKNRIVAWNDKARVSFGFAPQAVLGRSSGDILEIGDRRPQQGRGRVEGLP